MAAAKVTASSAHRSFIARVAAIFAPGSHDPICARQNICGRQHTTRTALVVGGISKDAVRTTGQPAQSSRSASLPCSLVEAEVECLASILERESPGDRIVNRPPDLRTFGGELGVMAKQIISMPPPFRALWCGRRGRLHRKSLKLMTRLGSPSTIQTRSGSTPFNCAVCSAKSGAPPASSRTRSTMPRRRA